MIESLIDETEWLAAIENLPGWSPPAMPMLVIAPHPDDETLGAGGLIAAQRSRGIDVRIVAVTDGERAYPDMPGLAKIRQQEQMEALERLAVGNENIIRLRLPDSNVTASENELAERLVPLVSGNTHVVAPWTGDFHPDHQACGRSSEQAARKAGATLSWYFFWTWHFGTVGLLRGLSLRRFPLDAKLLLAKQDALLCHQSQLMHEGGDPVLPESLLFPAKRSFEVFAVA